MTDKAKHIIGIIAITVILAGLLFTISYILRPEPDTITIKKAHYDSLKRELLTLKQINEKANNFIIPSKHYRDSVIADYRMRQHKR